MANEFIARNGVIAKNNSTVTGSLTVTAGITGSLLGTASYADIATTSSYVLQAVSASFASTASSVNQLNQIVNVGSGIQLNDTTSNISATSFTAGGGAVQIDGITGEVTAATFIGNLTGTASYATQALSASYAPDTTFPYTGSAEITGSLGVTGSFTTQVSNITAIEITDTSRKIYDLPGVNSIDINGRTLFDSTGAGSLDWENRFGYDNLGNTSINWNSRDLIDSSNTVAANWDAFALNYKVEFLTYLKRFIDSGTQELFSDVPTIGRFNYEGEVIEAAVDGTVNQFDLVYLETDGKWYPVTQGTADCSKLLGICAETGARAKIILEGSITVNDGSYTDTPIVQSVNFGLPIYIRESAGNTMSTTVPTTSGQYVRILGHAYYQNISATNYWTMKFRPSNEWIEL